MALLKNVEIKWAKLGRAENKYMSEDTQWSIQTIVTDEISKQFVKDGLLTKERYNEDDRPIISFRRDTHYRKTGDERTPPRVVDLFGLELDADSIGNGSICNIQYSIRDWEYQGRKGKSMELLAVQVIDHVIYSGGSSAGDEFDFEPNETV